VVPDKWIGETALCVTRFRAPEVRWSADCGAPEEVSRVQFDCLFSVQGVMHFLTNKQLTTRK
jgi:hypothetical protein